MIILKPRRVKILHKSFVPILIDRNYQLSDSHPADILCQLSFPNLLALCLYVKNFSATRYFYLVLSCLPSFPNFFFKELIIYHAVKRTFFKDFQSLSTYFLLFSSGENEYNIYH